MRILSVSTPCENREVTAAYLAAGIDPKRCIIFNQSQVTAHAELAWMPWYTRYTVVKVLSRWLGKSVAAKPCCAGCCSLNYRNR